MKISLKLKQGVHLIASDTTQTHQWKLDGSDEVGGQGLGARPMEVFLSSLAACTSMDVLMMCKKARYEIESFSIEVVGQRIDKVPKTFKTIDLYFEVKSRNAKFNQLDRMINLALHQYCSVAQMLKDDIQINHHLNLSQA